MKDKTYKLKQDNWAALQELYGKLYAYDEEKAKSEGDIREFWHYTSAKGVLGIFKDYIDDFGTVPKYVEKCSMLASNIRFMNDSKEYEEGVECFSELCKNVNDELNPFFNTEIVNQINDNIYLISFCGEGDLLSQWKWYGKNSGVSIRFNIDNIAYRTYEYINTKDENESFDFIDPHTKPLRIKYNRKEKETYFNMLLNQDRIKDSKAYDLVRLAFVPFCKHEGFVEEKESRLVFYIGDLGIDENINAVFDIRYNAFEEGRIKPALNVQMELHNERRIANNIISDIIVGPGVNQELVFNFLIHVFDRENYYFHKDIDTSTDVTPVEWSEFGMINDHRVYSVKCNDNKIRQAYRCQNGLIIMKSSIPFRG